MAPHSSTLAWKIPWDRRTWWAAVHGVAKSQTRLSDFTFPFHFHALEKEMATHASVLAWRMPGMGEPGGLLSMGLHRAGHDWSNAAAAATKPKLFFLITLRHYSWAFLVAQLVKYPLAMQGTSCNAGDADSIPGSGRSPEGGNGNTHQYSCLGNPMDRGAWWAIVHGAARVRHILATKPPQDFI